MKTSFARAFQWVLVMAAFTVLSGCLHVPVDKMTVKSSLLTTGGDDLRFKRVAQQTFTQADRVICVVTLEWPEIEKPAGNHVVDWKWYNNGKLVAVDKNTYFFNKTPFELIGYATALAIGAGNNKVEMRIDDKLISTETFKIE